VTKDEIMVMKPGRELDALVGEIVFGFKRVVTPPDYYGENGRDLKSSERSRLG